MTPSAAEADDAPSAPTPQAERRGVRRVQFAALCSILGLALALVGPFVVFIAEGLSLPLLGNTFASHALTIALLETIVGIAFAGLLLEVLAFGLYASGFGLLAQVDGRFRAPRTLAWVGLVGIFLVFLFAAAVLGEVLAALACAGSGVSACLGIGPGLLLAIGALALLGLILAFVGWIGLILGVVRAGRRYESPMLTAAGVLLIVPFVNLVAPILIFVAMRKVPDRFDLSGTAPPAETP